MGLLDSSMFDSEQMRLGMGLLAAGGARSDGANFGQRMQEAFGSVDSWKQGKADQAYKRQHLEMQQKLQEMQMKEAQSAMADKEALRMAAQQAMISPERANAMSMGPMPDGSDMPTVQPGFSSDAYVSKLFGLGLPDKAMAFQQLTAKEDAPVKLSPGEQLFSGKASGYKPLLSVPGKESALPAAVQEYKFATDQGYKGSFEQWVTSQKRAGASSVSVNMTDGQKGFENEMKLGGAFKQEPIYKAHQEVKSAFDQVNAALTAGTPVGDLAGATKIMKILDPGSVVRESELGMAMAAGGRVDRLQNYVKQAMDGTKLTPQQRTDFANLASELTAASAQTYNDKRKEYRAQGSEYGLNADRALGKPVDVPSIMKPNTPAAPGKLSLTAPNGKTYTFTNEREMANWKMATGVK